MSVCFVCKAASSTVIPCMGWTRLAFENGLTYPSQHVLEKQIFVSFHRMCLVRAGHGNMTLAGINSAFAHRVTSTAMDIADDPDASPALPYSFLRDANGFVIQLPNLVDGAERVRADELVHGPV